MTPDYWTMPALKLAAAWQETETADYSLEGDADGTNIERLNYVEDAILQRIGAPDDASGDDPVWQEKIRAWAKVQA